MKSFTTHYKQKAKDRDQRRAEFAANYTQRAQRVFELAETEAGRFNHSSIDTEHVLLGLVGFGKGVGANVLRRRGLDLNEIRSEVEKDVVRGRLESVNLPVPFTPSVKRVLVLAQNAAKALYHDYVGTEHILLGLLGEAEGVAARVLYGFGLNLADTRAEILRELDPNFGDD